jgi:hypothetical protein
VCRLDRSLFFDLNHLEIDSLVGRSLLLNSEDHDLVALQTEPLLFHDHHDEAQQLLLVLLNVFRHFVANNAAARIALAHHLLLR